LASITTMVAALHRTGRMEATHLLLPAVRAAEKNSL
jgi:hypothetical protein